MTSLLKIARKKSELRTAAVGVALMWFLPACGSDSSDAGDGQPSASGGTGATTGSTGGSRATSADAGDGSVVSTERFSFFVTSQKALQELSGSQNGFGGDLRFGETGAGAGLRGADKICSTIAGRSMPGAGQKTWRAFLSVRADENGNQVDAIDRIGSGPWYDRLGRLLAPSIADLLSARPQNGDATIQNDFPNEDGVPNHQPDPTQAAVDNHDMLTGTDAQGRLYGNTATCLDWTSALGNRTTEGRPRVGHSWPRGGGGTRPGGTGGGMDNWMSALDESGCAAGGSVVERGGPLDSEVTVGSGGGYGGFYCFALTP